MYFVLCAYIADDGGADIPTTQWLGKGSHPLMAVFPIHDYGRLHYFRKKWLAHYRIDWIIGALSLHFSPLGPRQHNVHPIGPSRKSKNILESKLHFILHLFGITIGG